MQLNEPATATGVTAAALTPEPLQSFSGLLDSRNLQSNSDGIYLHVGKPADEGWILVVSAIVSELETLLPRILDNFATLKIPFSIPFSKVTADNLLSTNYGYERLGQLILAYPPTESSAQALAKRLIEITANVKGPAVPAAAHLGGTVYVRHSSEVKIPFQCPKALKWPFGRIRRKPTISKRIRPLSGYLPLIPIKNDIKGRVIKGINMKQWWKMKFEWCLIKEGKRHMSFDAEGRSIRERLIMQRDIYFALRNVIPMPAVIDFFEIKGDTYLVSEFVEGVSLQEAQVKLMNLKCWPALPVAKRQHILQTLLDIIRYVGKMHERGFFHRDITPANFMQGKKGQLYFIDLELSYNEQLFKGGQPFYYGTPGFMSPEQRAIEKPTASEDCYGLAFLVLSMVSGLPPSRFEVEDQNLLAEHITFFSGDEPLARVLSRTIDDDINARPTLQQLETEVARLLRSLDEPRPLKEATAPTTQVIEALITEHLAAYLPGRMGLPNGTWYSYPPPSETDVANPSYRREIQTGLYSGIAGVLYVLSQLKVAGWQLNILERSIFANCAYLQQRYLDNRDQAKEGGLYQGSYGVAVALSAAMDAGIVSKSEQTAQYLLDLLQAPCSNLSIGTGVAGLGLAVLASRQNLPVAFVEQALTNCIHILLSAQQQDGSWLLEPGNKHSSYPGYSNGIAGISTFLLEFSKATGDQDARKAGIKGIEWLCRNAERAGNKATWSLEAKTRRYDRWFDIGTLGIVYALIRAYSLEKRQLFKELALEGLAEFPDQVLHPDASLHSGLAGLGFVLHLAATELDAKELVTRKDHVSNSLLNSFNHFRGTDTPYWMTIHSEFGTADFMNGNGGILLYLSQLLNDKSTHLLIL